MTNPHSDPRGVLALLTNFVPPTRLAAFEAIAAATPMTVLVDAPTESNRSWRVDHGRLRVEPVSGWTLERSYRHPTGFSDRSYLHLPIGLLSRLFRLNPSHVIAGEIGFRTAVACLYKMIRPDTRLAVWVEGTPHTDSCRGIVRSMLRRGLLRIPDVVVATSTAARDLTCTLGVDPSKVIVSYLASGYGPSPDTPTRTLEQRKRLLWVGQLIERKGIRPFMKALVKVAAERPRREMEIWFVGSGSEGAWLRQLALPESLKMHLLGSVDFERMPEIYRQCGILVFPTLADVWGLVTNEAMGHSMPVLGSVYAQSVCDLVEDNRDGWTFRPDDPADLQSAIGRAVDADRETLERMGRSARSKVAGLTPERFGNDLLCAVFGEKPEARERVEGSVVA